MGMAFIKFYFTAMFVLMPLTVYACPACMLSNNGRFVNQTILVVGAMWLIPVLLAAFIGLKICKLCRASSGEDQ
jgi:hypothetical protein